MSTARALADHAPILAATFFSTIAAFAPLLAVEHASPADLGILAACALALASAVAGGIAYANTFPWGLAVGLRIRNQRRACKRSLASRRRHG